MQGRSRASVASRVSGESCISLPGEKFIDVRRAYAQEARIEFLAVNFTILLINAMAGRVVYHQTNSLTMEIDFVTFGIDLFALLINIFVELSKRKAASERSIFILDLVGCFISLSLLIVVAVWGVMESVKRGEVDEAGKVSPEDKVDHISTMFMYSCFSLALSAVTMGVFWLRRHVMYPDGFGQEDRLNTVSSIAHTFVDLWGTLAVFGTSLTMMREESQGGVRWNKFQDLAQADTYGSALICFVTFMCSVFLIREAIKETKTFLSLEEEEEDGGVSEGGPNYGALQQA